MAGWIFEVFGKGRREGQILARILKGGSASRMAQFSLLVGIAYCIGPIDLIPGRTPYIGHLDEACALIVSFLLARELAPDVLERKAPRALQGTTACLPTFFIVGAARCGTTSLFTALSQHPDVFCCPVKEPNHFCADRNAKRWVVESARRRMVLLARDEPSPLRLPRVATTLDFDTYRTLFAGWNGEAAIGEASTAYLLSTDAARRIADTCPAARIIIVLRHPVQRAQSEYLMHAQLGRSRADLEAAIADWENPPEGELEALSNIVGGSLYAPQIARYLAEFPREQLLFLLFDEILRDPAAALDAAFAHIGVSREAGAGIVLSRENESRAVRSVGLNRALARSGLRETILHLLPRPVRRRLARRYYSAGSVERPPIPASLFAEDIERTSVLIGRDLSSWRN